MEQDSTFFLCWGCFVRLMEQDLHHNSWTVGLISKHLYQCLLYLRVLLEEETKHSEGPMPPDPTHPYPPGHST